mmetsp:Transcript_40166/g.73026  ORF Transcript_40166/g.73026 Transcript_40166/m.73026 type:complete len:180 (+) Transcript_40166:2-541(+)
MNRLFSLPKKHPVVSGLLSSVGVHVARYSAGDYLAQTREVQGFDKYRSMNFACFGGYCGALYWGVYGPIYTKIFQRGIPPFAVAFFDLTVTINIVYYPLFYIMQEYIQSSKPSVSAALRRCSENRWDDTKSVLMIFMPIHLCNFYFIPNLWRGLFSGVAGTVWAVFLSYSRGAKEKDAN